MREPWLHILGQQLIVLFFLVTAISNLTKARIADHIERMQGFGVPFPAVAFWIGIVLQLSGSAMIAFDWHPAIGTLCLIVFTISATMIFHRFWQKSDPLQRNISRITLLGNTAILGGLLLLLENVR
jgi:putative oxidoreductase